MSSAVAFVFGLCALSFAAGCVLTAFMLRREPEPEEAPTPPPAPPRVELKLDVRRPPGEYATKPIHRNPVLGMPVPERPAEPSRPALALVPEPQAERVRLLEAVPDLPATVPDLAEGAPDVPEVGRDVREAASDLPDEPAPGPAVELVAAPIAVDLPVRAEPADRARAARPDGRALPEPPADPVPARPARDGAATRSQAEAPARVEAPVPAEPVEAARARQVTLPDADEFRRRYLRTFEAARKRTTT